VINPIAGTLSQSRVGLFVKTGRHASTAQATGEIHPIFLQYADIFPLENIVHVDSLYAANQTLLAM
jgi:hypothetical protein